VLVEVRLVLGGVDGGEGTRDPMARR
jgi:hypothetical protein